MNETHDCEVKESLSTGKDYLKHLQDLLDQLGIAVRQVDQSAKKSENLVKDYFTNITKLITTTLERRRDQLLTEITTFYNEAIVPLVECQKEIEENMAATSAVLREGENILKKDVPVSSEQITSYLSKTSMIGLLPEVPNPAQVANINVNFSTKLLPEISSLIHNHGFVSAFSPVQIIHVEERPGGLVIHWEETDEENIEERTFGLQYCSGNVRKNPQLVNNYEFAYKGPEKSYLVRDIQYRKQYTFRVSCCVKNGEWKRWSEPHIAMTTIPNYEWESNNPNYNLTNDNKIATKLESVGSSNLYSKLSLQRINHSIKFHILDVGEQEEIDEGLALVDTSQTKKDAAFLQPGVIFINMKGNVYVNGNVMTNHLPTLKRNSMVIFDVEPLDSNGKIRVTIRTENQEITYDWKAREGNSTHLDIYFAVFFRSCGWKILVE
ncbi:cytokine receptor-like factor 3 [Centruroides vittatus]|uniref:cytokine receptor-like factor 3 n=1 Tax=Centruroides vittatus TaxID=120091 RepID=UPI00350FEE06